MPASKAKWIDWLALVPLIVCAVCLPQCHLDQNVHGGSREEKYVTVRLNDSLKRFDSVDIAIVVAGDTSKVVGRMWSGKLADPAAIPSFRLDDAEERVLSIRVRGFGPGGVLAMGMLISRPDGAQAIVDLPVPSRPGSDTSHPARPVPLDSLFPGWKNRGFIDIDIGSLGLNPGAGVRNFPLLVRLTAADFDFSQAGDAGQDLRFADSYGRSLAYEIGRWEPAGIGDGGGSAEIWVRLDSLVAGRDSARIAMGWGNPGVASESDGAKVFPAGDGYGTVLHLSEQGAGTAGEFRDATGQYPGTGGGGDGNNVPKRIDGVVGYGQDFHPQGLLGGLLDPLLPGAGQGTINLGDAFDPGAQTWTFQAWIKRTGDGGVLFQKSGDKWVAAKQRVQINCRKRLNGQVSVEREGAENITNAYTAANQFTDLGVVYSGSRIDVYVDGILRDTQNWTQGGSPNCRSVLGAFSKNGDNEGFAGAMDEVWIGPAARSPEWMRIRYENQKPASRFARLRAR